MQAFEVSHLRRIAGFDQRLETSFDKRSQAAAEHRLLAEQICFGLFAKIRFDDFRTAAANGRGVPESNLFRGTGRMLMNGEQARHSCNSLIFSPHTMPRPFRRRSE